MQCTEILLLLITAVQRNANYLQSYIEKGLAYKSQVDKIVSLIFSSNSRMQCNLTFRSMTGSSQNLLDVFIKYTEDLVLAMHKVLF